MERKTEYASDPPALLMTLPENCKVTMFELCIKGLVDSPRKIVAPDLAKAGICSVYVPAKMYIY